jgi:hypothetical protein
LGLQSTSSATAYTFVSSYLQVNGNAAATNFNPFTDDINAIRGQASGYATWNPLSATGVVSTSGGNLVADTVQNGNGWALSTIPMTSGKYYCEMTFEGEMSHNTNFNYIGIVPTDIAETYTGLDIFRGLGALAIESNSSKVRASIGTGSGATQSDWNTSIGYDESSTIGIAIDCDTPLVKFYVDGKDVGTYPYTMAANKSWVVFCNDWASGYQDFEKYILNAGQKPFKFPPPDGFQPMNLSTVQPETVIARPDQYVGTSLYTGNGGTLSVTNLNFKPDLVWIKCRSHTDDHTLTDSVRGADRALYSNNANQENVSSIRLQSFNNDGFTTGSSGDTNTSGRTFCAWTWRAGGDKNTFNIDDVGYASAAAAGLSAGTITPTGASVGTKQGFSIIKYTGNTTGGATVSHGLLQDPKFIMIKNLDQNSTNWLILHTGIGPNGETSFGNAEYNMFRFDNAVPANYSSDLIFPGSNGAFALGEGGSTWSNGAYNYIAYCWHNVPGLQKFGSYTGGGSSYPFVELGFRPAMIWIKDASTGGTHYDWKIYDSKRNPFNLGSDNTDSKNVLFVNTNDQENKGSSPWEQIDFLSNGFRMNDQSVTVNNSGSTYVYCAWAEAPSINLYGGQSNAF